MLAEALQALQAMITPDPATSAPSRVVSACGQKYVTLVRDGYSPSVESGPSESRAAHAFADVESLARWLNRYADPAACQILVSERGIAVKSDQDDPNGWSVSMPLKHHPSAAAWRQAFVDQWHSQKDLFRLIRGRLEDFPDIQGPKGGELGNGGDVLAGQLRTLTVHRGHEVSSQLNGYGGYDFVVSTGRQEVMGKLPPSFDIRIPLFRNVMLAGQTDDFDQPALYQLEVYLGLETTGSEVKLELSCPGWDSSRDRALDDLVAYLDHLLHDGFLVCRGTADYATVQVPVAG